MQTGLIISNLLLWVLLLLNFTLVLAIIRRTNSHNLSPHQLLQKPEILAFGHEAPAFLAETLDGEAITLDSKNDHKSLLVFITVGCHPCEARLPEFENVYFKAKTQQVDMLLMSLSSPQATKLYAEKNHIKIPILVAKSQVEIDYKIAGTPFYYFLDENQKVIQGGFLDSTWKEIVTNWQ